MITSKAYLDRLKELENLSYEYRDVDPHQEPIFNVNLNKRLIKVPDSFSKFLAVKGDHKAETIWFAVDRYFDGKDLSADEWDVYIDENNQKTEKAKVVWAVQFINALGEEGLHPIVWRNKKANENAIKAQDVEFYGDENANATFNLGWEIHYDLTKAPGKVTFSLRCYVIRGNDIIYNLGTEPVTAYIKDSLYIEERNNDHLMNPPKDNLTDLVAKITSLYENDTVISTDYITEVFNKPSIDGETLIGDMDSSFLKNVDYNKLQNKPVINVDGVDYTVGVDEINVTKITVDSELNSTSENPVQNKKVFAQFNSVNTKITEIDDTIEMIRAELGNMSYVPVKITSFINSVKLLEKNHAYNGPCTFSWEIDGNLIALQLINAKTEAEIPVDLSTSGEKEITIQNLTDDATYKLIAKGAKNENVAESKIIFTYKIFYGVDIADPEEFNSDFLNKLTSSLQTDLSVNFTTEANSDGYYIYYAAPKSYNVNGNSFWAGGFQRGFGDTPIQTIEHNGTNYDIWRTVNKQKDAVQITVK